MNEGDFYGNKEVFGAVYEKLTDRGTRKALGMFYTPDFIVDYILKYTIGELDILENPFVRILDPACGAGYFLVKAYDILEHKFKEKLSLIREKYANENYYIEVNNKHEVSSERKYKDNVIKKVNGADYWKEENLHYHILKHCLYGADVDPIAVEITKKNLKDKDDRKFTFQMNVVLCDSLIRWEESILPEKFQELNDILTKQYINKGFKNISKSEIKKKINHLSEFWNNKFDYIIGNPPYIVLLQSETDEDYWRYILNNYSTIGYKKNTFYLLIERALEKLKFGGKHGFIIPDRYFLTNSYIESRKNLFSHTKVINVTQFSSKVFEEAIVGTAVYVVEKNSCNSNHKIYLKLEYINEDNFCYIELSQKDILRDKRFILNILTKSNYKSIVEKIENNSVELKNFCKVHVGMMIKDKDKSFREALKAEKKNRIVIGRDLGEYILDNEYRYCCINGLQIFGGTKNLEKHLMYPKILLRKTGNSIIASIDEKGVLAEQSVYMVIPFDNSKAYSLLGQIQSSLSKFYFKESLITNPEAYPYIQHYDVEKIPINLELLNDNYGKLIRKIIDIKIKMKKISFNELIGTNNYNTILYNYKKIKGQQENLASKLESYIKKSNDMLYKAYGLKKYEIDLIKNRLESTNLKRPNDIAKERVSGEFIHIENYGENYYACLIGEIYKILKVEIIELLKYTRRYLSINEVEKGLKNRLNNFNDLIRIIREFKLEKENSYIVKDVLNSCSDNWSKYLRNKELSKQGKDLVRYSKNEYGLASWNEETHGIWFKENNAT